MRNSFTLPALLALAIAACQQPQDDSNIAIDNSINAADATNAADADVEILPPSEEAPDPNIVDGLNEADDAGSEGPETLFIPGQYRGRWGMNLNDCDPKRSDNKGLMTIGDTSVKFYESVAGLQEQRPAIATSFSGVYGFEGEGNTWERVMTFTRTGDTLKRAQADGNFTYTRCK